MVCNTDDIWNNMRLSVVNETIKQQDSIAINTWKKIPQNIKNNFHILEETRVIRAMLAIWSNYLLSHTLHTNCTIKLKPAVLLIRYSTFIILKPLISWDKLLELNKQKNIGTHKCIFIILHICLLCLFFVPVGFLT